MKSKQNKKIAHLLNEITSYLLEKDAMRIVSEIIEFEEKTTIYVCGKVEMSQEELEKLNEMLNAHHEYEYDEYWTLMGEGSHCDELSLVASLIDLAEIEYDGEVLKIYLERNK